MTTEKRYETATEAREQAYLTALRLRAYPNQGDIDNALLAIERAQEAAVLETLEAFTYWPWAYDRGTASGFVIQEAIVETRRRLDALAEEENHV